MQDIMGLERVSWIKVVFATRNTPVTRLEDILLVTLVEPPFGGAIIRRFARSKNILRMRTIKTTLYTHPSLWPQPCPYRSICNPPNAPRRPYLDTSTWQLPDTCCTERRSHPSVWDRTSHSYQERNPRNTSWLSQSCLICRSDSTCTHGCGEVVVVGIVHHGIGLVVFAVERLHPEMHVAVRKRSEAIVHQFIDWPV